MFKSLFNKISIIIPSIVSIIFVSSLWKIIQFQYHNPTEIIGYYSIFKHSHWNDNIRFVVFVALPLITFLITILIKKKITFHEMKKNFILDKHIKYNDSISIFYLLLLFLFLIFFFLSSDFNLNKIDLFHEGQALMGGLNYELKNQLWSGSFLVTSLFVDILSAKMAWSFFDIQSIGSYRIYISFITQVSVFILFIFLFHFCNKSNLDKNLKTLLFLFLSVFCFYLVQNNTLGYREIPLFIYLIFLVKILDTDKILIVDTIVLSILPLFALLWSLDRGIFLIAAYIPLFILLIINNRLKQTLAILSITIITFIIFFFIIGPIEFNSFITNSINILASSDLLNGIVHPTPFSAEPGSTRATKSLLIIVLNGFITIYIFFDKEVNLSKNHKLFITLFYIFGLIFYKVGLTRSDGGHIKQGSSFNLILLVYFFSFYFFNFLEQKIFFYKIKNIYFIIIYFLVFSLFIFKNTPNHFYTNIYEFKNRLNNYIILDDYRYLKDKEIELVNLLKILVKNENCFQIFTYETAIQYFLKKKTCTNFFHIMNLGNKKNQLSFINQLNTTRPKYLLSGGNYQNIGNMKGRNKFELTPKDRFPYINQYINDNYEVYEEISSWKILIIK